MNPSDWPDRPETSHFGPACWQSSLLALLSAIFVRPVLATLTIVGLVDVGGADGLADKIKETKLGEGGLHLWQGLEMTMRLFSPAQLNPFGHNPLWYFLNDLVDVEPPERLFVLALSAYFTQRGPLFRGRRLALLARPRLEAREPRRGVHPSDHRRRSDRR